MSVQCNRENKKVDGLITIWKIGTPKQRAKSVMIARRRSFLEDITVSEVAIKYRRRLIAREQVAIATFSAIMIRDAKYLLDAVIEGKRN